MPTVNIYYKGDTDRAGLKPIVLSIKSYLADKLTCGDIKLGPDEISVRLMRADGDGMLGNVELDITAHEFSERVEKQDIICHETKEWLEKQAPSLGDVRVWLRLCQLGHDILPETPRNQPAFPQPGS